jgi:hypothetical protein
MTDRFEAQIPQKPKNKHRKRCYTVWHSILNGKSYAGGKVVWLTDAQLTLARIKYPHMVVDEVLERDKLEEYKKYLDQTIE